MIRTLERHLGHAGRPIPNLSGRWFVWDGDKVVAGEHVDLLEHAPDGNRQTGTAL